MQIPLWFQNIFSSYTWNIPNSNNTLFLTFDDGPTEEITSWVLELLKKYDVPATFFIIGDKVSKAPTIFQTLKNSVHQIGNHSFNHLVGWRCENQKYIENINKCQPFVSSKLFRPPHGRIKPSQAKQLQQQGYIIVMWDVLSGDFDRNLSSEYCLDRLKKNTKTGSIIVFHDSIKAEKHLKAILEPYILWAIDNRYCFDILS